MATGEVMKDVDAYCPHKAAVDGFCQKCKIYLCKKCQVADHFDHIDQIQGLDAILTHAIHEYETMGSELEKNILTSNVGIKDGAIDETLLDIEKRIGEEYDKLLKDIKNIEDEQAAVIHGTSVLGKIQRAKEDLEGEDLKALAEFDKKLGTTISQLLGALESEKYESVAHLLTDGAKQDFTAQAKAHEGYYAKQQQFLRQIDVVKGVKPKITYNSQTVDELVQVKGVHEEVVRMLLYEPKGESVYTYYPKTKVAKKSDIGTKLAVRKYAQITLEDDMLFICGGKRKQKEFSAKCYLYVEAEKKLTEKAPMGVPRASHSLANRKDQEIYVAGGENTTGVVADVEVYDVKTNVWRPLPSLTEPKKNISLCIFADKYLYAIGGASVSELATIEVLNLVDPKAWERKVVAAAPAIEKAATIQIADNQLLIFGGKTGGKKTQACFMYDLSNGTFTAKDQVPIPAAFNKSDTKKIEGRVYATGNGKGRTFVYDVSSNQWTMISEKDYTLKYSWD